MPVEFVRQRKEHERVAFSLWYDFIHKPGCSYSFPCDEDGTPLLDQMGEALRDSLEYCQRMTALFKKPVVLKQVSRWVEPAVLRCDCGEEVAVEPDPYGTVNCHACGRLYNSSGQRLNPRSQWEENLEED